MESRKYIKNKKTKQNKQKTLPQQGNNTPNDLQLQQTVART